MGVQWKPWAWDMVKERKIRGFSIVGAAARVEMAMPEDLEKASFGGNRSEAGRYAAYVRWRSKAHSIAQASEPVPVDHTSGLSCLRSSGRFIRCFRSL